MDHIERLALIRNRAAVIGLRVSHVALLPGLIHASHSEVHSEFASLAVNASHAAPFAETTADDTEDAPFSEHLLVRLGALTDEQA